VYTKVFRQMFDGSLATVGPWEAMVTFQQFLILADRFGDVDMTAEVISRTSTIPLEIIRKGIAVLTQPDPSSRSPEEDGRRLVLIAPHRDWGWKIVNYEHYSKIRSAEERREYKREWMRQKRLSTPVDSVDNVDLSYSDSDSYSDTDYRPSGSSPEATAKPPRKNKKPTHPLAITHPPISRPPPTPYQAIGDLYNEICVSLPKQKTMTDARKKALQARWKEHPDLSWWKGYFEHIRDHCPFLTGGGQTGWVADFDFVIKEGRMASIREGKYSSVKP